MTVLSEELIQDESKRLIELPAVERVQWAHEVYGDQLVMSTSFGVQSAVMLHLVTSIVPKIPVLFLSLIHI